MEFIFSSLDSKDVDSVDSLMKRNSATLGFLSRKALLDYLCRGTVIGAHARDRSLAGYLLYASNPQRIRIAHLCVCQDFRGRGLARSLFEELKARCNTQCVIRLNCRRDYAANDLWPLLDFVPVDEKPGRSIDGLPLTCWEHRLREDKQLDLFKESASDHALDVVIDAQVLFHFNQPLSPESKPSKALLADFLADLICIRLTDEIFHEIERQADPNIRKSSRSLANSYSRVTYDRPQAENYVKGLSSVLPSRTDSDVSDIKHLAQTAASPVSLFVTQDERILRRSQEIANLTDLEVVSPENLVIRLHELLEKETYRTLPISGQALAWRRATSNDARNLVGALLQPGEVKGRLRETIQGLLSEPEACTVEILWRGDEILGARASTLENKGLTISLVRAVKSNHQRLIERFLVWDALTTCPSRGIKAVKLKGDRLLARMSTDLSKMGFQQSGSDFYRLALSGTMARDEFEGELSRYFPDSSESLKHVHPTELLKRCSPVVLEDLAEAAFLIPIKPNHAMSLFDRRNAAADLFGGKSLVLMSWENVYYRRKTHHWMLRAPARLLWYESGKEGAITALSHLEAVEIASPKILFRKFRKLGTLEWKDIFQMCHGDTNTEIMALRFSHTFAFPHPVSLGMLRQLEGRYFVPLQSPRSIEKPLFLKIVETGFAGST